MDPSTTLFSTYETKWCASRVVVSLLVFCMVCSSKKCILRVKNGRTNYTKPTRKCARPLSHSEITALIQSLETSDYKYQCSQPPLVDFCQSGICVTRRFGIDASERDPVFGGLKSILLTHHYGI